MIVRFRRYRSNKRDVEVKTKIKRIVFTKGEIEIEFDGRPTKAELKEIARRLSSYKIEVEPPRHKSVIQKIREREKHLIDNVVVRIRANAGASG